jgi:hypothetical protein
MRAGAAIGGGMGWAPGRLCLAAWLAVTTAQDDNCPPPYTTARISWVRHAGMAATTSTGYNCIRSVAVASCTGADSACCTGAAQCLETAKSACSEDWRCRAVGYNEAELSARLYRADYAPMELTSQWDMYIKVMPGCNDQTAENYDAFATELEEGACEYTYGCLDATNPNYDPMAGRHDQSLCAIMPEPEPEPEPPPEPEPAPEPEPWACPPERLEELSARLLSLTNEADCFSELMSVTRDEAASCSEECKDAVEADGVFHVCDATEEHAVCLEAANHRQSYPLAGRVWQWQNSCLGTGFDPCNPDAGSALAAVVDPAVAIAEQQAQAARLMQGSAVLVTLSLSPWPDGSSAAASTDAPHGWPPLRGALAEVLRVAETSVLLHSGWSSNSTSLQLSFVLSDDPGSDRSSRHVYTELLKRVRMFLAAPPLTDGSLESADAAGADGGSEEEDDDDESNPLPLPAWQPTAIEAEYGAGNCESYDSATGVTMTVPCTSGMAVGLQWIALLYQVGVAFVVAAAVSIHATQHMTKWM